jgi:uncharacterized membrane protein YbaN (DUF454 family)
MRKKLKRGAVLIAALAFLVLGVVGLVLPFLQGILFLAIGLILLSLLSPRMRAYVDRRTFAYPKVHKVIRDIESWVLRVVGDI